MNFYREPYISFFLILKYDVAIWGCVLKDCNSFTRCFIVRNFIKWLIKKKWNFKINYDSFECNLFSQFNVWWRFSPLDFGFQSFNTLCYAPQGKNRILKNSQRLHLWHIGLELNGIIFKVYFRNPLTLPDHLQHPISVFLNSSFLIPFAASFLCSRKSPHWHQHYQFLPGWPWVRYFNSLRISLLCCKKK